MNSLAPPVGAYFFYGTLKDPSWLAEILNLAEKPKLRPAKLVGYKSKLWGPYPALVDGPTDAIVEGMVYQVQSENHANRLARYETNAYAPVSCQIRFTDGKEPGEVSGMTFKYVGNPVDIDDGQFNLTDWLQSMGRPEEETSGAA